MARITDLASTSETEEPGWPGPAQRAAVAATLAESAAGLTTATLAAIADLHPWFAELDAEHRSWITMVARAGIDGFVEWFAAGGRDRNPEAIFDAAPRALTRRITLNQTVDLVRTTIDTVEAWITGLDKAQQDPLRIGILRYSREVAFAAARVYARAAEARGAWDARLEAMVVDAVIRGEADETVVSRASTLGWVHPPRIAVIIGPAAADPATQVDSIRAAAAPHGLDLLAAPQGDRLVLLVGGRLASMPELIGLVADFVEHFGTGPVVVGPIVNNLLDAARSARAALSGIRAAPAWPEAPRPVAAEDLLAERALAGDGHARRTLSGQIFQPINDAGGDLVETLATYFETGGSVEATARARFIHPNTVRYRLRRIQQLVGYSAFDARDAYVLRLALTLGRLVQPPTLQ